MFVFCWAVLALFGVLLFVFSERIAVGRPGRKRYVRLLGGLFVAAGALGTLSVLAGAVTLPLH